MKPHRAVRVIRTYGQTPLLHVTGPGVPDMQPQRGSQPEGGITQKTPALEHEHIQQTIVGHGPGGDSESTSIIATVPRQPGLPHASFPLSPPAGAGKDFAGRPRLQSTRMPRGGTDSSNQHPAPLWLSLIHISEPTRLRRISYAVFCLKKKKKK